MKVNKAHCAPEQPPAGARGQHEIENRKIVSNTHSNYQSTAARAPNSSFQSERFFYFIAFTDWASRQLVSSFINCALCERGFAKPWWSAHTHSHKCYSNYLLARSWLESISFIYFPAGKCAVVLVKNCAFLHLHLLVHKPRVMVALMFVNFQN